MAAVKATVVTQAVSPEDAFNSNTGNIVREGKSLLIEKFTCGVNML